MTKEKALKIIDRAAFFFFAVLAFWLPVSKATIEICFAFLMTCFILRFVFEGLPFKNVKVFFKNRINLSLLIFFFAIGLSLFASGPLIKKSFYAWIFNQPDGALLFERLNRFADDWIEAIGVMANARADQTDKDGNVGFQYKENSWKVPLIDPDFKELSKGDPPLNGVRKGDHNSIRKLLRKSPN